jgi:hypothetical protein
MPLQVRARPPKGFQIRHREIAAVGQDGIDHRRAVSLGENEPIALRPIGPVGIVLHQMVIQGHNEIRSAEAAADVPRIRLVHHREDAASDLFRLGLQMAERF